MHSAMQQLILLMISIKKKFTYKLNSANILQGHFPLYHSNEATESCYANQNNDL